MKFDFNDILLLPEALSNINSRSEVNILNKLGMLPLMTAPMDTVVSMSNYKLFIENKITAVLPRNNDPLITSTNKNTFLSYGIEDFKRVFLTAKLSVVNVPNATFYALLDVANGNMKQLFDLVLQAKKMYGNELVLMVGNIANPKTFELWCEAGVDYVRCGIGNGNACLTTEHTGVGYPNASLIKECYEIKKEKEFKTKIIADGGFKKYSDIIKALALGADYVMLGSMLNKCVESSGKTVIEKSYESGKRYKDIDIQSLPDDSIKSLIFQKLLFKDFRGMSTKEVQREWNKTLLTSSEGITKFNRIEYTLEGFIENFSDYLKSAMSYTNSKNLTEFKESRYELITENAFLRFSK